MGLTPTLYNFGNTLRYFSAAFIPPIILSLTQNDGLLPYFLIASGLCFLIGSILKTLTHEGEMKTEESIILVASIWLIIALFGSIPFLTHLSAVDAYFESMSGFTATGLTMFKDVESLPQSLLLWRSIIEWVGGIGIVAIMLAAILHPNTAASKLYKAEGRTERIATSIVDTVKTIWKIYVLFTIIGIALLYIVGMPLFDATNHSLTAIATGGFSTKNESIGAYDNFLVEIVIMLLMFLGATSFGIHAKVILKKEWKALWKSSEFKAMVAITTLFTLLFLSHYLLNHHTNNSEEVAKYGGESLFHVFSALSGTGFNTVDLGKIDPFQKGVLTAVMIFGGGYGSTASALKLIRVIILILALKRYVIRAILPREAVLPLKIGGRIFKDDEILENALYSFMYISLVIIGAFVLMAINNFSMVDSLFEVASAAGNVGLSIGITSVKLGITSKTVLIITMWAGRLEVIPILVLIRRLIYRREGVYNI